MSAEDNTDLPEPPKNPAEKRAALLVSVLAMVLAVASLGGGNATKDATHQNLMAANAYSHYQAKNIRQNEYRLAADTVRVQLTQPLMLPATRELLEARLADYERTISRYESEPQTGEGKKELMARARQHEADRDVALRRDPWFDYAQALLQIAIVVTSVSIITGMPVLVMGALMLGGLGTLATLNGFLLLV